MKVPYLNRKKIRKGLFIAIGLISTFVFLYCSFGIYTEFTKPKPNPADIIDLLLIDLVAALVVAVMAISIRLSNSFALYRKNNRRVSRLRKRIIVAFSIGSVLPTIIITIFSTYFFSWGIEAWFDKKISKVLEESVKVGESYIEEHVLQLKETAISVADDLNSMYYDLIHNTELFNKVINAQAELRSLDEAIVFQQDNNTILAQTPLSFSLAFMTIPGHLIERAERGEAVRVDAGSLRIRILIKLRDYNNTYLILGRLVDQNIIDHIDKTNGSATEYNQLKEKILITKVKFSMIFILVSLGLLLVAITWGRSFAEKIVKPIKNLVIAAEKVKNGDYSAQVTTEGLKKDEIKILSTAFNRMIDQIDRQQKELIIAQRSLAWSDVARRVAHEIKNPLTPIQLSAERLLKKFGHEVSDPESYKKYVNNILRNSTDIKTIVSEFVEFAKLPAPTFVRCEIVSLINDIIESRKLINDKITYYFNSKNKTLEVPCDVSQINRAVTNLLLNAEESLNPDKGEQKISVELKADEKFLYIRVKDNGPGFSVTMLRSAKEAYVTGKIKGTGLGLSIVDRIVADHFGELKIYNNPEGGASVELILNIVNLKTKIKNK